MGNQSKCHKYGFDKTNKIREGLRKRTTKTLSLPNLSVEFASYLKNKLARLGK